MLRSLIRLLTPGVIHRALEEHEAVFEAIRRRDPAGTGAAMLRHMRNSKRQRT